MTQRIGQALFAAGIVLAFIMLMALSQGLYSPAPVAPRTSVTVTGEGIANTAPFNLGRGDWSVRWSARARPDSDSCYHGATLRTTQDEYVDMVVNAGVGSGTGYLYNLDGGRYFLSVSSGCVWSFTFRPE